MEKENQENILPEGEKQEPFVQETQPYVPRPAWQIWAARIGLVAFIVFLIMYYTVIFRGN